MTDDQLFALIRQTPRKDALLTMGADGIFLRIGREICVLSEHQADLLWQRLQAVQRGPIVT